MKKPLTPEEIGALFQEIESEATGKLSELAKVAELNLAEDYVGIDLSNEDLSEDDLSGANFSYSNLRNVNLKGTNLTKSNLTGADLTGADLTGANLTGADLTGANLTGANLTGADLTGANLTGADLNGVNLSLVSVVNTKFSHNSDPEFFQPIDVAKFSTFIKVDDSNLDSKRRQNGPKLERNVRELLEFKPQIRTEQDLVNYWLNLVLKNQHLLRIILEKKNDNCQKLQPKEQEILNARNHLSAYLDEVCYWQALKIYDQLQPYNYNLEKKEIFSMAREVAANPEVFNKYDFRRASFKTFAGKVIYGKVLHELRKRRERERYFPTGLLRNISDFRLRDYISQAISNSSEIERYLLAFKSLKEIYNSTIKEENKILEILSNKQLENIAKLYEKQSPNKEKITSQEINKLLDTCVQTIRDGMTTIEFLDATDIGNVVALYDAIDETDKVEYLELHQQIKEVLVNKLLSFPDNSQKMLELKYGLNLTNTDVAVFSTMHRTTVVKRVKWHIKELSLAFSEQLSLTLSSENLNLIHQYIVPFLNNYCTDKFGDLLSEIIGQNSSETINLLTVLYGKYSGDIRKATEYLKASKYEKNNNNELEEVKPQFKIENESDLEDKLKKVKQELQSELETYVANNYSSSLLESESVKKKIAIFIENYLKEYPYANIH